MLYIYYLKQTELKMSFQPLYNVFNKIQNISNFIYSLDCNDNERVCVNCSSSMVIVTVYPKTEQHWKIPTPNPIRSIVLQDYIEVRLDSNHDVVGYKTDYIEVQIGNRTEYIDKNQSIEVITRFLTDLIKGL